MSSAYTTHFCFNNNKAKQISLNQSHDDFTEWKYRISHVKFCIYEYYGLQANQRPLQEVDLWIRKDPRLLYPRSLRSPRVKLESPSEYLQGR